MDREQHLIRQQPKHPGEAHQEEQSTQQADAEFGGQLGEVLGVCLHALVGINANLAGKGEQVGPLWRQPLVEEVVGDPLPHPDLDHLAEPCLRDDQCE